MKINFLSAKQAADFFKQPDEYALNLPKSNLDMIVPENPTVDGYQEMFLKTFKNFSKQSKSHLSGHLNALDNLNFSVKMISTNGSHLLDLPQTRKDAILAPRGTMTETVFVHEVYHVLSRAYPQLTPALSKIWGFERVPPQEINAINYLLNPDSVFCDYTIKVVRSNTNEEISVTPFLGQSLRTNLKVFGSEEYMGHLSTNYDSLIMDTRYHAQPEEICAEYFALSVLGRCCAEKFSKSSHQLDIFKETLQMELQNLGLIKDGGKLAA